MRNSSFLFTFTLAGAGLLAACGGAPPPAPPIPEPTAEVALQGPTRDSLDAVRRADSVEWARQLQLVERAYFDSVEQVRLAGETSGGNLAHEAALTSADLQRELGVMIHFDVARAQVLPDGRTALDRKMAILKANPTVRLQITGACDERGSDLYNVALGERRAAAVRQYFVESGINAGRLDEMSSGETSPIDTGSDEAAWAMNRRAEFVIVSGNLPLALN